MDEVSSHVRLDLLSLWR